MTRRRRPFVPTWTETTLDEVIAMLTALRTDDASGRALVKVEDPEGLGPFDLQSAKKGTDEDGKTIIVLT